MAKYILANNGRISGRTGANVLMRNGNERIWVNPANPTSYYRSFIRNAFSLYTENWKLLTQNQMQLWHNFSFNKSDIWGNSVVVSGIEAFISCNIKLAIVNNDNTVIWLFEPISAPIIPFGFIISPLNLSKIVINSIYGVNPTPIIVSATQNLSAGVFKPRQCDFRIIGVMDFSYYTSINALPLFFARFAIVPIIGSKIFLRCQSISQSGIASPIYQSSSLVS